MCKSNKSAIVVNFRSEGDAEQYSVGIRGEAGSVMWLRCFDSRIVAWSFAQGLALGIDLRSDESPIQFETTQG